MTAYEDIAALNWSTLKLIDKSPKLLKHRATVERKDSPALRRGRAIHCAVFEPEHFDSRYLVRPDFGDLRRKGPKVERAAWLEANARSIDAGADVLPPDEGELVRRVADAVRSHPRCAEMLRGGRVEEPVTWTDPEHGIACKARVDFIRPDSILDLKSTRRDSLRLMFTDFARYLYHGQIAWYHYGCVYAGRIPERNDRPYMIAAQTVEPFDVVPIQLSADDLEAGRRLTRELLDKYVACTQADWWPGLAPELVQSNFPQWAAGQNEETASEDW